MSKKLMRKKLAMMLATLKKKRKFFCEVEYLESTGTQLINTGIPFVSQDDYVFKTRSVNFDTSKRAIILSNYIAYNQYSALSLEWWAGSSANNGKARAYCVTKTGTSGASIASNDALSINVPHDLELNYSRTNNSILLKWDGNTKTNALNAEGLPNYSGSFCLFLDERPDPSAIQNPTRIYYLQIYHNNTLVRDLIPVLDWDMTPCMYDKVSGQLFYNQGTGNFVAGREIHPVEYIETDGTSYINTGYTPSGSTETEITTMLKNQNTSRFMFGCRTAGTTNIYACLAHSSGRLGYRVGNGGYRYFNGYNELNVKHTYKIANGVFYRDDVVVDSSYEGATTSPNSPLALLTINTNNVLDVTQQFIGNLYSCTIKEDDVLVRDYIPAIDENGVGFMFDRVSHTIYDNAGTGAFSYPAREVEYLESTGEQYIDTGYKANNTTKVETKTRGQTWTFGGRTSLAVGDALGICFNANLVALQFGSQSINYNQTGIAQQVSECVISQDGAYINGVLRASFTEETFSSPRNLYLFNINNNGSSGGGLNGKMWYCRIYDNGTLVRDFVPSYKDGVLGMWDKANDVFYLNAGTGTFTTGKIVESEYE